MLNSENPASFYEMENDIVIPTKWKFESNLFLPERFIKITAANVSAEIYLTHKEIFGKKYNRRFLKASLARLSKADCIILISKILTILENDNYFLPHVQRELIKEFFDPDLKAKIFQKIKQNPQQLVFTELQLLVLAKYALLYAKDESPSDFQNRKLYPHFIAALLGVTDLLTEGEERWGKRKLQEYTIRNLYFHSRQNFLHTITRAEKLFIDTPSTLKAHHQYMDLNKYFKKATGISLENYIISGYALIAFLVQQKAGKMEAKYWHVDIKKHFSKARISKTQVNRIFKEYAKEITSLRSLLDLNKNGFEYNFKGIRHHPLVSFDKRLFYPLGLRFLKEKMTLQIYWIIWDYIKLNYGNVLLSRYTNFMGIVFEEYVFGILNRIFPTSPFLSKRLTRIPESITGTNKKKADFVIVNPNSLTLIETKVSQLKVFKTGILGNLTAFREDIEKIITESLDQIQSTKEQFQQGLLNQSVETTPEKIKFFYPLIITCDIFPMNPILWEIVEIEIKKLPNFDKDLADNLQIMDIDELERIEEFVKVSGVSLEELLRDKSADKLYKRLSFKNYLYYEYPKSRGLKNQYLDEKYRVFTQKLRQKLFGKKLAKKS